MSRNEEASATTYFRCLSLKFKPTDILYIPTCDLIKSAREVLLGSLYARRESRNISSWSTFYKNYGPYRPHATLFAKTPLKAYCVDFFYYKLNFVAVPDYTERKWTKHWTAPTPWATKMTTLNRRAHRFVWIAQSDFLPVCTVLSVLGKAVVAAHGLGVHTILPK